MPLTSLSESRFNMWRAVIHLAHADGIVTGEESEFILDYLNRLPFTPGQKTQLKSELKKGSDIDEIMGAISDAPDRAMVVHFARILCFRDGEFHPSEKQIIEKLHTHAMKKTQLQDAIQASISAASDMELRRKAEHKKNWGLLGVFFDD